jgi:hypothetical protein
MTGATSAITTAAQALAFVAEHGVVLVSAKGPAPRLTEAIAGEPVTGSWWGHAQGQRIFTLLEAVKDADQVLVCRLINGKLTLVHRRLWPLLARIADRLQPAQLARVREEHTPGGRHVSTDTPFPDWMPADLTEQVATIPVEQALAVFAHCLPKSSARTRKN